jgi:spore coat protein CotH
MTLFRNGLALAVSVATLSAISGCRPRDFNSNSSSHSSATQETRLNGSTLWSQSEQEVFKEPYIHQIFIKLNAAAWAKLHDDEKAHGCKKSDDVRWVHVRHLAFDGKNFPDSAIKVKGNTSRCVPRLQFSVQLNRTKNLYTTQGDGKWWEKKFGSEETERIKAQNIGGVSEFSIRRSFNDSSSRGMSADSGQGMLMRETVATWAMAQTEQVSKTTVRGAPVYRTGYTMVEFQLCDNDNDNACNTRFRRAYVLAEAINKSYFAMRYDDPKPTAISLSLGCGLKTNSAAAHAFRDECEDPLFVDGKKYEDIPEMKAKLVDMLDGPNGLISRVKNAKTAAEVREVVDLDSFLNYIAGASLTGHWDSALGNWNNDVVYFHSPSKKWKMITWDMDNTFDFDGPGKPSREYAYRKSDGHRAVLDPLLAIPEVDALLRKRISDLLTRLYSSKSTGALHDRLYFVQKNYIEKLNNDYGLHPDERQNTSLSREMFDYTEARFENLKKQL